MLSGKRIKLTLAGILSTFTLSFSQPSITCEASFSTFGEILITSLKTLYNTFPIRIAGIPIIQWPGLEDKNTGGSPICLCKDPFPRIGITLSFWEPYAIVETTKIPWCFPTVGLYLPMPFNFLNIGSETSIVSAGSDNTASYQVHWFRYLPWMLLGLFIDAICFQLQAPFDLIYPTEVDPLWNEDTLAMIFTPEAYLFANPLAHAACSADAFAVNLGFPIDILFWCVGSWGQIYPFSKNVPVTDPPQASGLAISKMMYKLHRQLMLWGTMGIAGLCGFYPMPIWKKSMYGMFPIYPVPWGKRFPPGRWSMIRWGIGKDLPIKNRHNWVWMLYRKRDCCAF